MYITSLSLSGDTDQPYRDVVNVINANIQNGNITVITEVEAFPTNESSPDTLDGLRFKNGDDVLFEIYGVGVSGSAAKTLRAYSDATHYRSETTTNIAAKYSYPIQLVCCKRGMLVRFTNTASGSDAAGWVLFSKTKNGQTMVAYRSDTGNNFWASYCVAYGDDYTYRKQSFSPTYAPNYSAYVPIPTNFQSNSPNYSDGSYFLAYSQFVATSSSGSSYTGGCELNGIKGYTDGGIFIMDQ